MSTERSLEPEICLFEDARHFQHFQALVQFEASIADNHSGDNSGTHEGNETKFKTKMLGT